jgi:tetratricopeptide (TPR) repeat protein
MFFAGARARLRPAAAALLLALGASSPLAHAQPLCQGRACTAADFQAGVGELHQIKTELVNAIRQFAEAAAGSYGDEQRLLLPALDTIQRTLDAWDRAIAVYENTAHAAAESADIHVALGSVYLDRSRTREALIELAAAARLDPRRATVHDLTATAYELAGDLPNEIAELQKSAALDSRNLATLYRLATALASAALPTTPDAQRRFDAVHLSTADDVPLQFDRVALMRQTAGVAPIFPPERYVAGFRQIDAGAYREGIALLRQAVAGDPLGVSASAAAGAGARLRQGQLQAALSGLRAAIENTPEAETLRAAGLAYWADEQYDKSIDVLRSAIRISPTDERSRIALADVLVASGQRADAEQALKETIALIPGSGQAHYRLGELYESESLVANAIVEFERSASCGPLIGLDYLYDRIGRLYATEADFAHAADAYRKRVDVNPNNADAHRRLGEIYALQGSDAAALVQFDAAVRLDSKNGEAFAEAAQAYLRTERLLDAERAARKALALDPLDLKARFALGTALVRQGSTASGQRELESFRIQTDATAAAQRRVLEANTLERDAARAEAYGDYDTAASLLARAADIRPADPRRQLELARVLIQAGKPQEALARLAKMSESGDAAEIHRVAVDAYLALGQQDARAREETRYRQLVEQEKEERLKTRPLLR